MDSQNNETWKCKNFKEAALASLKGRWKIPVLASLFSLGIWTVFVACFYPWKMVLSQDVQIGRFFLSIAILLVAGFTLFPSLIFAFLRLMQKIHKTDEKVCFSDFLKELTYWKTGVRCALWQYLWFFLWYLLIAVIFVIIIAFVTVSLLIDSPAIFSVIMFFVYIGFIIGLFNRYYSYMLNIYIASEFPNIKARKSLPLSIKMTKGYKKRFFVLDLSFIGWYLLCCLTLGIGMFWYVPYYTQTVIKAYNFIKKDALEKGIVAESDFTECSSEQIEDKTQNS